jgi:hypothetical protein
MLRWENEEEVFFGVRIHSFLGELPWIACSSLMRVVPFFLF